jgi:hypothetical protein
MVGGTTLTFEPSNITVQPGGTMSSTRRTTRSLNPASPSLARCPPPVLQAAKSALTWGRLYVLFPSFFFHAGHLTLYNFGWACLSVRTPPCSLRRPGERFFSDLGVLSPDRPLGIRHCKYTYSRRRRHTHSGRQHMHKQQTAPRTHAQHALRTLTWVERYRITFTRPSPPSHHAPADDAAHTYTGTVRQNDAVRCGNTGKQCRAHTGRQCLAPAHRQARPSPPSQARAADGAACTHTGRMSLPSPVGPRPTPFVDDAACTHREKSTMAHSLYNSCIRTLNSSLDKSHLHLERMSVRATVHPATLLDSLRPVKPPTSHNLIPKLSMHLNILVWPLEGTNSARPGWADSARPQLGRFIQQSIYRNFEPTRVDLSGLGATELSCGSAWPDLGLTRLRSPLGAESRQHYLFQLPNRKVEEDDLTYAIALPKCCNDVVHA